MTCADAIQADLSAALDRIPPAERGVTAMRAAAQIEDAAAAISANLSLLEWEAARVQRVAAARAERERQAQNAAAQREAERKEAERTRAARRLDRIARDQKLVKESSK